MGQQGAPSFQEARVPICLLHDVPGAGCTLVLRPAPHTPTLVVPMLRSTLRPHQLTLLLHSASPHLSLPTDTHGGARPHLLMAGEVPDAHLPPTVLLQAIQSSLMFAQVCGCHQELCILPATVTNNVPGAELSMGCDTGLNALVEVRRPLCLLPQVFPAPGALGMHWEGLSLLLKWKLEGETWPVSQNE